MGIADDIMDHKCDCSHPGSDHHPFDGCLADECECAVFRIKN